MSSKKRRNSQYDLKKESIHGFRFKQGLLSDLSYAVP